MKITIAPDRHGMGKAAADQAAAILRKCLAENGAARLVVATGSSQFEVLKALTSDPQLDWTRIDGFHLDEYIGLPSSHPASFCGYLKQRLVDRVPIRSFFYLDGTRDPETVCREASERIAERPIDVALIGIGENGHLAFNDPPADFHTRAAYHRVELDEACRRQQVGEGWFDSLEQVPTHAISMTIHQILQSKELICSVPDRRKAEAVHNALEGPISTNCPASILQQHPSVHLYLDRGSSELLDARLRVSATQLLGE
jgi:glucosamine-6-phosphate deaminase